MNTLFADRTVHHCDHLLTVTATKTPANVALIRGMIDCRVTYERTIKNISYRDDLDALADAALETLKRSVEPPVTDSPLATCPTTGRVV